MRILVTSTSGMGHIHPMVPLATELQAAGHDVLWATPEAACPLIERLGFRSGLAGLDGRLRKTLFAQRAPRIGDIPGRQRRAITFPLMFGKIAAPAMREDLAPVFDAFRPELVLHELAELAAAPMAVARGIPHVTVGFSGALSDDIASLVLDAVSPLWALEKAPLSPRNFNGDLLVHPFPRSMDTPRRDGPSSPIGPVPFGGAPSDAPPAWIEAFGAERPGIYVTFGTELAQAAPWHAILNAVADLQVDVVATIGSGLDAAELGAVPSNVRIERFVAQRLLLDKAALVVSHAGAGTLIGAAVSGCPQLHLPLSADQWDNADLLASTGAGLTLELHQRTAGALGPAIERLLTDEPIRTAARNVRADFLQMPHPREATAAIERLARVSPN